MDGIHKYMEVLKVKNWKELTRNRKEWKKLAEKAKTHPGLSCCRRRRRRRYNLKCALTFLISCNENMCYI
jgi:hypothetical protein